MKRTNIALIGFMGCGKSLTGKALSSRTGMGFFDADAEIEAEERAAVSDIFARLGEARFRMMETETLKRAASLTWTVIATGGGAIKNPENVKTLKKSCILFYLKSSPQTLYEHTRLSDSRPLLNVADPMGKIVELLAQRDPIYASASDCIIKCDAKSPDQIVDEIIEVFRKSR
ncbi:MAG: shikimate kinase [Clostridiales bacterium]|jgi:shikimate kinase|nr:shikimate kinase [Clostridiales bacterium]